MALPSDEVYYMVHLSDITCVQDGTTIRVFWHKTWNKILLGYNGGFYPLPGKDHYNLTVRHILHSLGWNENSNVQIEMDYPKAIEYTREDILDGDAWNATYHQIYIDMPTS